ncbi:NAD-binding protein [Amanita rubescens]|nr:NAD-binding protein [Amanita rubescens]
MAAPRRVAIVTGAASGIGKAIVLKLASDGFDVALNDLPSSLEQLKEVADLVASQNGANTILVPGDVSSEADVEKMLLMVANAGIADQRVPITELTTEQWDRMQMIKQGRGGRVVGACSLSGLRGKPNDAHYCAAKFAIRGLTQSVAQEVGKHTITVNVYAPGLTRTPLIDKLEEGTRAALQEMVRTRSALGYEGEPEDVANVVSFLLSDSSRYITGQTISVNGGLYFN